MSADAGAVQVEPVESIRPSVRLPTVLKRCEDAPVEDVSTESGSRVLNHQQDC